MIRGLALASLILAAIWLGIAVAIGGIMAVAVLGTPEVANTPGLGGTIMGRAFRVWGIAGWVIFTLLIAFSGALLWLNSRRQLAACLGMCVALGVVGHGFAQHHNQTAGELRRGGEHNTPDFDRHHRLAQRFYGLEALALLGVITTASTMMLRTAPHRRTVKQGA